MSTPSIPTFPILYKSKANGKVNQWKISIKGNSPYQIETIFGELEGAQQTHTTIVSKGKANRTILQQATLEAQSKWNEKRNKEGYQETIQPASIVVRPMLANTFQKELYAKPTRAYKLPFPVFTQRKYDGIRCLCHFDKSSNSVVLESRKGTPIYNMDHIQSELYKMFYGDGTKNESIYFDGELYTSELNFETINGIVRLGKLNHDTDINDVSNQIQLIEYHVYDLYDVENKEKTFQERNDMIRELFNKDASASSRIGSNTYNLRSSPTKKACFMVQTDIANNLKEIKQLHDQYVAEGFEGIMLRDKSGVYESNKRSKYLQKYKEFLEEEFEIIGYHDGEGIDKYLIIWECITKDGIKFSAKPRGSHEYRRQLFQEADQYIGKQLTVVFQEYSADGTPRFPVGKDIRYN